MSTVSVVYRKPGLPISDAMDKNIFLQNSLGIPYNDLSEERAFELLRGCGVDPNFLGDVEYQAALPGRGTAKFEHDQRLLRRRFRELFSALGHDIVTQAVPSPRTS